jgi:preprotein translocase subunit Sss1
LLDEPEKARQLNAELIQVFQEHLTYFSQFSEAEIESVFDQIERNLLMYDQIIKTAAQFDTEEYANSLKEEYVNYIKLFEFLISE